MNCSQNINFRVNGLNPSTNLTNGTMYKGQQYRPMNSNLPHRSYEATDNLQTWATTPEFTFCKEPTPVGVRTNRNPLIPHQPEQSLIPTAQESVTYTYNYQMSKNSHNSLQTTIQVQKSASQNLQNLCYNNSSANFTNLASNGNAEQSENPIQSSSIIDSRQNRYSLSNRKRNRPFWNTKNVPLRFTKRTNGEPTNINRTCSSNHRNRDMHSTPKKVRFEPISDINNIDISPQSNILEHQRQYYKYMSASNSAQTDKEQPIQSPMEKPFLAKGRATERLDRQPDQNNLALSSQH